jgi:hypothetical protein
MLFIRQSKRKYNLITQIPEIASAKNKKMSKLKKEKAESLDLFHGGLGGVHELGSEAKLTVSTKDSERSDMTMTLVRFFFHFGQNVTDNSAVVIFSDIEEMRPREDVVKVIFHLVIFGQA